MNFEYSLFECFENTMYICWPILCCVHFLIVLKFFIFENSETFKIDEGSMCIVSDFKYFKQQRH